MRSFILSCAIILMAGAVQAKPADVLLSSVNPAAVEATPSPLLDTARTLIHRHSRELGLYRPLGPADTLTPQDIAARIAAMAKADRYARTIINGLSGAAGVTQRATLEEELAPALAEAEAMNFASLLELLAAPDVAAHGWFTASRFGADTERVAGELLASARGERAFLAALRERIAHLAQDGEASAETLSVITELLGRSVPNHGLLGAHSGEQG